MPPPLNTKLSFGSINPLQQVPAPRCRQDLPGTAGPMRCHLQQRLHTHAALDGTHAGVAACHCAHSVAVGVAGRVVGYDAQADAAALE
jgi:hypothetical protein